MVRESQFITDVEEKELLEKERKSLLQFKKDAEELLHIKNNIEKYKQKYIEEHPKMTKDELLFRFQIIDDLYYFIKNYN